MAGCASTSPRSRREGRGAHFIAMSGKIRFGFSNETAEQFWLDARNNTTAVLTSPSASHAPKGRQEGRREELVDIWEIGRKEAGLDSADRDVRLEGRLCFNPPSTGLKPGVHVERVLSDPEELEETAERRDDEMVRRSPPPQPLASLVLGLGFRLRSL